MFYQGVRILINFSIKKIISISVFLDKFKIKNLSILISPSDKHNPQITLTVDIQTVASGVPLIFDVQSGCDLVDCGITCGGPILACVSTYMSLTSRNLQKSKNRINSGPSDEVTALPCTGSGQQMYSTIPPYFIHHISTAS